MASGTGHGHRPSALIAILIVPVIVAIALSTFAWPAANLEPRDLPFGLAGPAPATAPFEQRLEARAGAFDVHMVQGWLGIIEGPWLLNAAVLSLGVLAIACFVTGLASLIGPAGIGVAAVLMVFVGNPWSGTASAPELSWPGRGCSGAGCKAASG